MAGNIVKWWKHKILGGYKQFSVLQECTTDSEELIYPLRASSTCSAPPDLLMTSDPIGLRTPQSMSKNVKITTKPKSVDDAHTDKMCLEEFTCDVSVEGGKSSQPLQFSFTFYDLDGHHHGKITKDDIAGLVYTIYESIGKSVVVPHCGSKTINVRLTVSPDTKSKTKKSAGITSRKSRYKPRKLLQSDDDDDDSENVSSDKIKKQNDHRMISSTTTTSGTNAIPLGKLDGKCNIHSSESPNESIRSSKEGTNKETEPRICCTEEQTKKMECSNSTPKKTTQENVYESINNIKCCTNANLRIDEDIMEVNGCRECSLMNCPLIDVSVPCKPISSRKVFRKSRARKQKSQETYHARVRSLSVGNENSFRNEMNNGNSVEGAEECLNNLRRNDLIDIIRESMEKNRLCFQSTGKTTESPTRHRHRSHTISKFHGDHPNPISDLKSHSKTNRCGYDSFLHATMCSNNVGSVIQPTVPLMNSPKKMQNQNNRAVRSKHKTNEIHLNASPQLQGYTKLNSMHAKLNMSMLNQLNPHLTPEQKFSRTINHVEKWLNERDQVLTKTNDLKMLKINDDNKNKMKDIVKDEKNIDNLINTKIFVDKLKITEKCTEKFTESPKKTFNKEALLTRKSVKGTRNLNKNQNLNDNLKSKGPVMEYASIPITVDPSECENLLRASCSDDSSQTTTTTTQHQTTTTSSTNNNTHIHIHHHFHHFENGGEI